MTAVRSAGLIAIVVAVFAGRVAAQVDPAPEGRPVPGSPVDAEALKAAVDRILARVVVDLRRELHAAIDDATRAKGAASLDDVLSMLEGRGAAIAPAGVPEPDPLLDELLSAGFDLAAASPAFHRLHRIEDRRAYVVVAVPGEVSTKPSGLSGESLSVGDVVIAPAAPGGTPELVVAKTGRRGPLSPGRFGGPATRPGEASARGWVDDAFRAALGGKQASVPPRRVAGDVGSSKDARTLVEEAWRDAMRQVLGEAQGSVTIVPAPLPTPVSPAGERREK